MTDSGEFDARPVRAFLPGPGARADEPAWPASVPAMAQLLRDGLELPTGLTVVRGQRPRWSPQRNDYIVTDGRVGGGP
jgi:hypothetical protein